MKALFLALLLIAPLANAQSNNDQESVAIPVRVVETKALVAPSGAAPGRLGQARATLILKVVVNFCRSVAPEQFVVDVQQTAEAQTLEVRDVHLVDCRAMGRDQVVELHVSNMVAYKPVVVKNQFLIDWFN